MDQKEGSAVTNNAREVEGFGSSTFFFPEIHEKGKM